jgi:hypothetical protein
VNGPDFSHVDSLEKAHALFERGELDRILLLPEQFGGKDIPENVVYVPRGLGEAKSGFDRQIRDLIQQGLVDHYEATPRYQGRSFIPITIEVRATSSKRPGSFGANVEVWGEGLSSNRA